MIKAIRAVEAYADGEENGVHIVKAAQADFAERWFIVEGSKKAWRRVYVVDCSTPNGYVVEVVGGSQMSQADLIIYATRQRHIDAA